MTSISRTPVEVSGAPWEGRDARGLKAPADCIDFAVISLATGKEVARVWTLEDARFVAAAPDLYEALRALIGEKEYDGTMFGERIAMARAALAKVHS